jgi:hypothetical protein
VLSEGIGDPESLGFAYQTAATLIATDFREAQNVLLTPSQTASSAPTAPLPLVQWRQRIDQAIEATGFAGQPSFALSAVPTRGLDLPQLVVSQQDPLVQMIEKPPTLRRSGFDLSGDPVAKLASRGRVRRAIAPGYKLLELWRDGCLIFVAHGADFLCRDIHDNKQASLKINTLVLAESTFLFCELAKRVFLETMRHPRTVQYSIEFRNLTLNGKQPVLIPYEVDSRPWPGTERHEAEYGGERFTLEADVDTDADVTAFDLTSEIYSWFNIERDQIPYATVKNGVHRIDIDRIRSLRN